MKLAFDTNLLHKTETLAHIFHDISVEHQLNLPQPKWKADKKTE